METSQAPAGRYRWWISSLLFAATTLYYFDRQIFSYVINGDDKSYAKLLKFLGPDGKVDNVLYGYIDTAHKIAYAIGFLLMGRFLDWIGLKKGFAIGVAVWSLATISAAFLHSFWPLFVSVLFLGFFQASNHPGCVKTVSEWFPARDRSLAVGFYNSGTNFGAMIVSSMIPFICVYLGGWRMAYVIPGLIGFIWVFLWLRSYDKPESHGALLPAELAYITSDRVPVSTYKLGWGKLMTNKQAWGFAIAKFLIDPVWFIYLTWLPKIFKESYHVDFKSLFVPITLIYTVSLIGNFVGGGLSSYFLKIGWNVNKSRKIAMLVFALIAVPSLVSAFVTNMWVVVAIVGCVTFAHQAYSTLLFTTVADVFPKHVVGSVTGFGSMFGAIGGILAAFSAGYITKAFGYAPIYFLGSFAYLLGLVIMHLMNPQLKHVDAI